MTGACMGLLLRFASRRPPSRERCAEPARSMNSVGLGGSWSKADALISKAPHPAVCFGPSAYELEVQRVLDDADLCPVHEQRRARRLMIRS